MFYLQFIISLYYGSIFVKKNKQHYINFLKIERIEKGIVEEVADEQKKSEWDILQESTDDEYLRRTVMPLLHPVKTLQKIYLK